MAMDNKFKPENIRSVKGQEGGVENEDKAWNMALACKWFYELAKVLEDISEKPTRLDKLSLPSEIAYYTELRAKGISPEYARAVGDLAAESAGASYDYEREAAEKTGAELEKDIDTFAVEFLSYKNKNPYVRTESDQDGWRRIEQVGDTRTEAVLNPDIGEALRVWRLLDKFFIASKELQRKKESLA